MARCRKILASGKRCKVAAISGTRYCVFHTTGKGMRRAKKKVSQGNTKSRSKNVVRRTAENQLAVRGSKKVASATAAYGAYLQSRPYSTTYVKYHPARYNRQGTVIVGAHTQRTHMPTRTRDGRGFVRTDQRRHRGIAMGRGIVWGGRLIPVLGYGYVMHNTLSGPSNPNHDMDMLGRTYQGGILLTAGEVLDTASSERSFQSVERSLGAKPGYGISDIGKTIGRWVFA